MRRTNAESSDTFTAKQGFFDRTLAPHTDRLGVSCRVQAKSLVEVFPDVRSTLARFLASLLFRAGRQVSLKLRKLTDEGRKGFSGSLSDFIPYVKNGVAQILSRNQL